jgi:hypothetical protein
LASGLTDRGGVGPVHCRLRLDLTTWVGYGVLREARALKMAPRLAWNAGNGCVAPAGHCAP